MSRIAAGLVAVLLAAPPAAAEMHAEVRAALRELKLARRHLRAADGAYGGHRDRAVDALDRAIGELRGALAGARRALEQMDEEEELE
jgi:hypothetical protein